VATGFNRNNGLLMGLGMMILRPLARSPEKGAETLVWLATSPDVANVSGAYELLSVTKIKAAGPIAAGLDRVSFIIFCLSLGPGAPVFRGR